MTKILAKLSGALTAAAVLATLSAAPVMAQEMGDWDADGDGFLNQDEFNTGWADNNPYSTWDGDGDGALTEDEFNTGVFNSYDRDGTGMIEEPEFGDVGDDMGDGGFWDV